MLTPGVLPNLNLRRSFENEVGVFGAESQGVEEASSISTDMEKKISLIFQ
jgi:hypothetical protein